MSKSRRKTVSFTPGDMPFAVRRCKAVPHEFVLDALAALSPWTRPMFGCLAVYVQDKIVLILRDKPEHAADNGVWLATTEQHHQSLRQEFPNMRSIQMFGKPVTGWQVLPAESADFEAAAVHVCDLVLAGDPRIGKVPGSRRRSGPKTRTAPKPAKRAALRRGNSLRRRK